MSLVSNLTATAKVWATFGFSGAVALEDGSGCGSSDVVVAGKCGLDAALLRVQEAYDSCTRTCGSIRECSKTLLGLVPPDSLAATSTRTAITRARSLEPFSVQLEKFLFESDKSCLNIEAIKKVHHI